MTRRISLTSGRAVETWRSAAARRTGGSRRRGERDTTSARRPTRIAPRAFSAGSPPLEGRCGLATPTVTGPGARRLAAAAIGATHASLGTVISTRSGPEVASRRRPLAPSALVSAASAMRSEPERTARFPPSRTSSSESSSSPSNSSASLIGTTPRRPAARTGRMEGMEAVSNRCVPGRARGPGEGIRRSASWRARSRRGKLLRPVNVARSAKETAWRRCRRYSVTFLRSLGRKRPPRTCTVARARKPASMK